MDPGKAAFMAAALLSQGRKEYFCAGKSQRERNSKMGRFEQKETKETER
jgi:hypothetical protein